MERDDIRRALGAWGIRPDDDDLAVISAIATDQRRVLARLGEIARAGDGYALTLEQDVEPNR